MTDRETLTDEMKEAKERAGWTYRDIAEELEERRPGTRWTGKKVADLFSATNQRDAGRETIAALADMLDPGRAPRWCALAGHVHATTAAALTDPAFAEKVYKMAVKHLKGSS